MYRIDWTLDYWPACMNNVIKFQVPTTNGQAVVQESEFQLYKQDSAPWTYLGDTVFKDILSHITAAYIITRNSRIDSYNKTNEMH